jgi:putative methionine-R-sulfoxide reductase with GAF domain
MRTHIERIDAIEIFLREGEEAVLKARTGLPDWVIEQIHRLPFPEGYTWKVIRDGQPRYCGDVDRDAFIHSAGRAFGVRSYVAMPIRAEGQTVGVININSLQKQAFDDDELRLLEILSAHLETAINNAQQAEALRQALAEVERLRNRLQAENAYLQEELTTTHRCAWHPPICRGATTYGGLSSRSSAKSVHTMAKVVAPRTFPLLTQVVRDWHRPCYLMRYARRWHDQHEVDISFGHREHHLEMRHDDSLRPSHRAGKRQSCLSRTLRRHLRLDGQTGPRPLRTGASQ